MKKFFFREISANRFKKKNNQSRSKGAFYDETNKTKLNGCKRNHYRISKSSFICISDDDDLHRYYDAWNVKGGRYVRWT